MKTNTSCDSSRVCQVQAKTKENVREESNGALEIIYGYDPLCGWCYGFSPDLEKVRNELGMKVKFTLINGGIFAGPHGLPMSNIRAHILKNMSRVTEVTGVNFGSTFIQLLNNDSYSYDSEKSSIAVNVFRDLQPEHVFEFASNVQEAFFYNGADLNTDSTFLPLIRPYKLDEKDFIQRLNSEEYKIRTYEEFAKARAYKLAFPSCTLITNSLTETLSFGYEKAESLLLKIKTKLLMHASTL